MEKHVNKLKDQTQDKQEKNTIPKKNKNTKFPEQGQHRYQG